MNASTRSWSAASAVDATGVIEAARFLFERHGYDATSVRDIALRAGVSVGSVNNVGSKGSLYLVAMAHLAPEGRLLRAVGTLSGDDAHLPERLWGLMSDELDRVSRVPDLARVYAGQRTLQGHDPVTERLVRDLVVLLARKLCRRWGTRMPDQDALTAGWAIQTGFAATWAAFAGQTQHRGVWQDYLRRHVERQCRRSAGREQV